VKGHPTTELVASRVAPRALAWLEASGPIRFLHIFEFVCNLIDSSDAVLSIHTGQVSPGPISLEVGSRPLQEGDGRGFQSWFEADAQADRGAGVLRLGPLNVRWDSASLWDPRPDWARIRQRRLVWQGQLTGLVERLRTESPGGLAALLGGTSARAENGSRLLDQLVAAARVPALQVLTGLESSDTNNLAIEGARALAGLGGGLTPSGDDFLIGVMHALWATLQDPEAKASTARLAAVAAPRTTPLSAAWLQAAADGEAAGHWHALLMALADGHQSEVDRSCRRLLSVGHSSGADALTGFVATLLGPVVLETNPQE
jgi:hypothetical protein